MAAKIKKGDKVVILTGRDKGKSGEVVQVMPKETRALVSGVNLVKRHQRQTQTRKPVSSRKRLLCICPTLLWQIPRTASLPALGSRCLKTAARFASPNVREI